jgi:hypothetical protein
LAISSFVLGNPNAAQRPTHFQPSLEPRFSKHSRRLPNLYVKTTAI